MLLLSTILLFSINFHLSCNAAKLKAGSPIILVPGDGGSQIEAKLNKPKVVHYVCSKTTADYFVLWLNLELLAPVALDCFVDNMRLVYDNVTKKTSNSPGVLTRIPQFGNTSTVEYLDPSQNEIGAYYSAVVAMATNMGYRKGKDIRGAPYDFRKAPNELNDYYTNLTTMVEETYYHNGNKKVVLVGHSLGNPVLLYFLNNKRQIWKDKFIKSYISISAPWGGSMKVVKVLASGYNMDHWRLLVEPYKLRTFQRSMPSSPFLLPTDKFWPSNQVLAMTDKKNYTVNDYKQFFADINFPVGWDMYQNTKDLIYDLTPPRVKVHCLYSKGLPTPAQFKWEKGYFPDYQPTEIMGDGDGTVNLRSLEGCLRWKSEQKEKVISRVFEKAEHLDILQDVDLVAYIRSALYEP